MAPLDAKQLLRARSDIWKSGNRATKILPTLERLEEFQATESLLRQTKIGVVVTSLRNNRNAEVAQKATALVVRWKKEINAAKGSTLKTGSSCDLTTIPILESWRSTKRKAEHLDVEGYGPEHFQIGNSSVQSDFRGFADVFAIAEVGEKILLLLAAEEIMAACAIHPSIAPVVWGSPALRRKLFLSQRNDGEPGLVDFAEWRKTSDDLWLPNPLFCNIGPRAEEKDLITTYTLPWRFFFTIADDPAHVYDVWYETDRSFSATPGDSRFYELLYEKGSIRQLVVRLSSKKSWPSVPPKLPGIYKNMLLADRPAIILLDVGKELDSPTSEWPRSWRIQAWLPPETTLGDVLDLSKLWTQHKLVLAKHSGSFRGITHFDVDGPGRYARSSGETPKQETAFMQLLHSIKPRRPVGGRKRRRVEVSVSELADEMAMDLSL